jgi:hypothetical protein
MAKNHQKGKKIPDPNQPRMTSFFHPITHTNETRNPNPPTTASLERERIKRPKLTSQSNTSIDSVHNSDSTKEGQENQNPNTQSSNYHKRRKKPSKPVTNEGRLSAIIRALQKTKKDCIKEYLETKNKKDLPPNLVTLLTDYLNNRDDTHDSITLVNAASSLGFFDIVHSFIDQHVEAPHDPTDIADHTSHLPFNSTSSGISSQGHTEMQSPDLISQNEVNEITAILLEDNNPFPESENTGTEQDNDIPPTTLAHFNSTSSGISSQGHTEMQSPDLINQNEVNEITAILLEDNNPFPESENTGTEQDNDIPPTTTLAHFNSASSGFFSQQETISNTTTIIAQEHPNINGSTSNDEESKFLKGVEFIEEYSHLFSPLADSLSDEEATAADDHLNEGQLQEYECIGLGCGITISGVSYHYPCCPCASSSKY